MKPQPPYNALKFLRWFCREDYIEEIEGDLCELFEIRHHQSPKQAKRRFTWDVLRSFRLRNIKKFYKVQNSNHFTMIKHAVIITLRNFRRYPGMSSLNILGLAIGLAASLLVIMYVAYESSYDSFHEKSDNLYRVRFDRFYPDNHDISVGTCPALAPTLEKMIPEIESAIRVKSIDYMANVVSINNKAYNQQKVFFADARFFEVFTFPKESNSRNVLERPFTVVISESAAVKYFGNKNAIGEIITLTNNFGVHNYEVTDVVKNPPQNSHLKFELLLSFATLRQFEKDVDLNSGWNAFYSYVLLKEGTNPKFVEEKFDNVIDQLSDGSLKMAYSLQPLKSLHLQSNYRQEPEPGGSVLANNVLIGIALFLLFISWANYINLVTATTHERSKEVGVRKTMGADMVNLLRQFLTESFFFNLVAITIAIMLIILALPAFSTFVSVPIDPRLIISSGYGMMVLGLFLAGIFISGMIPAIILSKLQPIRAMKEGSSTHISNWGLRKVLIVTQFSLSIAAVSGTLIIGEQISFMQSYNTGIDMEQILLLKTPRRIENIANHLQSLKTELLKRSDIKSVSVSSIVPGLENTQVGGGFRLKSQDDSFEKQCYSVQIDDAFKDTFGIELLAGSMFSKNYENEYNTVVMNEMAVNMFGFENSEDAIGQLVINPHRRNEPMQIIGVVNDFHQLSLKNPINPTLFTLSNAADFISIKLAAKNMEHSIAGIEKQWLSIFPNEPFDHSFLDQDFQHQYQEDLYFSRVFALFSGLTIVIACLGLFGLAAYTLQKRTKEIGIRKVLGASIIQIMILVSRKYLLLIFLSTLLAAPFTFWIMNSWLDNFAYHIDIEIWIFLLSGTLGIVIALITVSHHAIRASLANPIKSLKSE